MNANLHNRIVAAEMTDHAASITLEGLSFEDLTTKQRAGVDMIMDHAVELKDEIKRFAAELKNEDGQEKS